jgi:putative endonuclease
MRGKLRMGNGSHRGAMSAPLSARRTTSRALRSSIDKPSEVCVLDEGPVSRTYHVYILSSTYGVLYTGVTGDLAGRIWRHRQCTGDGFTARYKVTRLVWFEATNDIRSAIAREKQIKGWTRAKKLKLIAETNPDLEDLSREEGFIGPTRYRRPC